MNKPKFSAEMEAVGETLLQLKKVKQATDKLIEEHTIQFSQMAAHCGYEGKWESSLFPGSISVCKAVKLVKERDCLTTEEQKTLTGRQLLERKYSVVTKKLEELLDAQQIRTLVDGGALKETYKTVGGGSWDTVTLSAKSLREDNDFSGKIDSCVNENLMEWTTPLLRTHFSAKTIWMGSTKHEEFSRKVSSNLQPIIGKIIETISSPRNDIPNGPKKEEHCQHCGVFDASVIDVSGKTPFFDRLCGSCEDQLCENCHKLEVGPLKAVESEGYTQDWCEDCWAEENTQTLVEDLRDAKNHFGEDPEDF